MTIEMLPMTGLVPRLDLAAFTMTDGLRQAQGVALDALGLGPEECAFQRIFSGPHWHLRAYGGVEVGPTVLIVPAPIKRPYIWDLTPAVSAVRYCLDHGLRVHLLEWIPPDGDSHAGLDDYAGRAIATCVATISSRANRAAPFLFGHSLGGTLAAIYCALEPGSVRGVVLLSAPLSFEPASSRFRDALISMMPAALPERGVIAGSLLSEVSAAASPNTFLWSRWIDAALSLTDPVAMEIHARVERWTLDEVPLSGKLVNQVVEWLYRENRFCRGSLSVLGRTVGPDSVRTPMLAIVNAADEVGPLATVVPFIHKLATKDSQIIEYPGEIGVGLQHLGILAGREAYKRVWPQIITWLKARG